MAVLDVLYQDSALVLVNKPAGVLVHRSALDRHAPRILLQELRDQIGQRVYPVHRLDRPTSGIMVFALSNDVASQLSQQWRNHQVEKHYLAVVRGYAPETVQVEIALREEDGLRPKAENPAMAATTMLRRLETVELPVCVDRYPTSRYSLVAARPLTGRRHQIRRHLSHIGHPIIGDAKHGKGVHNRYFKQHYFVDFPSSARLLLAATMLRFTHPITSQLVSATAPPEDDFMALMNDFGWQNHLPARSVTLDANP
ncbi:tRNA pseudouridine synthase C [Halomonadaceae bacterium LMG 33818]|uniref:pseudouridine synthase n=1 Tax=Cernens ardua TaxID=3402176 RepID=UPI003EDC4D05